MRKPFLTVLIALVLAFSLGAQTATQVQVEGRPLGAAPAKAEDYAKYLVKAAKPEAPPADIKAGFDTISAKASLSMLTFIASDLLEGREAGTRGYQLAAEYGASLFGLWGLTPIGDMAGRSMSMAQFMSGAATAPRAPEKTYWQRSRPRAGWLWK